MLKLLRLVLLNQHLEFVVLAFPAQGSAWGCFLQSPQPSTIWLQPERLHGPCRVRRGGGGGGGRGGVGGLGGIRVDVVTERRDGSLLVDVERHFVVCGGGGMEEEAGVVG